MADMKTGRTTAEASAVVAARWADLDRANARHHAARTEMREADACLQRCEAAVTAATNALVRSVIDDNAKDTRP